LRLGERKNVSRRGAEDAEKTRAFLAKVPRKAKPYKELLCELCDLAREKEYLTQRRGGRREKPELKKNFFANFAAWREKNLSRKGAKDAKKSLVYKKNFFVNLAKGKNLARRGAEDAEKNLN